MSKDLDEDSYKKRIENIEKGKSYLKSNGFFRSGSNIFDDIQKFIYKKQIFIEQLVENLKLHEFSLKEVFFFS